MVNRRLETYRRAMVRCLAVGVTIAALSGQSPEIPPAADKKVTFSADIEPIFQSHCQMCHGPQQQLGGLRLDNGTAALAGGYSGAVIRPGDSAGSRLILLVSGVDKIVMPMGGARLTPQEVGLLRAWIDQGAKWPSSDGQQHTAHVSQAPKSDHWAFQPISRPAPPAVREATRVNNVVDRFVVAKLESEGIDPSPEADKATLARRVSLDLVGLPPTPEDLAEFLADKTPGAYERFVDRLLESPHFGEKWAMHWLDLARYADSDGYDIDLPRPFAWRYRQWVIDALNNDKPFDRFTLEQIAGDVLPGATIDQRIATGFHRNTLKNREGGVKLEQFRFEETVDRTNTLGSVWLGLTVGCAQCHDHKYDPFSQKDYYQLFAFFNNLVEADINAPLAGEMGPYLAGLPEYRRKRHQLLEENHVLELQPAWEEQMRLAIKNPGKRTDWDHAFDALEKYLDGSERILWKPVAERTEKETERLTDHFVAHYERVVDKERWKELDWVTLKEKLLALKREYSLVSEARVVEENSEERQTHIHIRGDWRNEGIVVQRDTPGVLPRMEAAKGEHPRQALARWLVSRDNPLTARVFVNRIWQEYFGKGIVTTPEDFGKRSEKPLYLNLLDWLAADFMESGWKVKRLHKTIVMSATYRQSSIVRPELEVRDPDNRLLAHQVRLRLPAELIRDSALRVSGLLYPEIGGPSVRPPQPEGVARQGYESHVTWAESTGKEKYRRGLYIHFQRSVPYPMLMTFDSPERTVPECGRKRSNTPLQALNLLNDPVFAEAARGLAAHVLQVSHVELPDRLRYAFRLCLSRDPNSQELSHLSEYYQRQVQIFETEPQSATKLMPLELANTSQVESAAWVGISSVLLNLDEFVTRE